MFVKNFRHFVKILVTLIIVIENTIEWFKLNSIFGLRPSILFNFHTMCAEGVNKMIYIDEEKLTWETIMLIGRDYGVSDKKYNMSCGEGIEAYVEEVFKVLDEETEKEWIEMEKYIIEDFLEEEKRKKEVEISK